MLGDFEQAQRDYERSLGAARQMGEGRLEWQSHLDLGFLWTSREYQRAGAHFQQALELAIQLGDAGLHAHSLNRLGNWLLNTGQVARAQAAHHEALTIFTVQDDRPGMAETLDLLGTVSLQDGDSVNAVHWYGRAIDLLQAVGNRRVLCSCLTMRASCACPWGGETSCTVNWTLAECERDLLKALQLARELEWAAGEAFAELIFGGVLASFGRLEAALAHGQQGLRVATEIGHQQWIAAAHSTLARLSLSLLAPEQALAHVEAGSKVARALGSAIWIAVLSAAQIQAYVLLGQPQPAEVALQEVRRWTENPHQTIGRALLVAWVELALLQQKPALALQHCEQLLATAPQRAGEAAELVIPRLWKYQGEALAALGRTEEATRILEEARRGAQLQQSLPLLWQIERSLGRTYQQQRRREEAQQMFAAARQGITLLAKGIEDPVLRLHFECAASVMLPKEKPVSLRRATAQEFGGLSEREREVAALIGQGKSNAEMADLLVVSRRTVETYVSRVLAKLGLSSRSQIALWTRDRGLVPPPKQ
jgi:DNA-binding CsgD family transcriptional regulator/tetratricopeptide (TPR) repeat protein